MIEATKLAGVVGVVVGDLERCDWSEQRPEWPRTKSLEQVLEEHLEPLGVPATLDGDAPTLTVDRPALQTG